MSGRYIVEYIVYRNSYAVFKYILMLLNVSRTARNNLTQRPVVAAPSCALASPLPAQRLLQIATGVCVCVSITINYDSLSVTISYYLITEGNKDIWPLITHYLLPFVQALSLITYHHLSIITY